MILDVVMLLVEEVKKSKKLRGNRRLDEFIQKQYSKPNKEKEEKPKPVQITIA